MSIPVASTQNSTVRTVDVYLTNPLKHLDAIVRIEPHQSALAKVTFTQLDKSTRRAILLHKHQAMKITSNKMKLDVITPNNDSRFLRIDFNTRKRPENTVSQIIIKDSALAIQRFISNEDNAHLSSSARSSDDKLLAGAPRSLARDDFLTLTENIEDFTTSQIKIEFISANSIEFLTELKQAIRLEETPYQNSATPLAHDYKIINDWLKYTHLGGLKTSLLGMSNGYLNNIFANIHLPTHLDELLKINPFKETMVELESAQDFIVFRNYTVSKPGSQMIHHLKDTRLFKTPDGEFRLAQQLGFILLCYKECEPYRKLIKEILIDVMSRCVDRAQRQLSTAVVKTILLTTTSRNLNNDQVASLLVNLYKEFIIDQAAITASGFSKESVEDALYVRDAFANLLHLQHQGKVLYKSVVKINSHQRANLLVDVCYQFGCYDNLILFIREHEEMIDVLIAQTLPWYKLRIESIQAQLNELSEHIDNENFSEILNDFLVHNGLSTMEFKIKNSFQYYDHVMQQLKMDTQLPVLVVLKTLQDSGYLDERAFEYCPELQSINEWQHLYLLMKERIPWLAEPDLTDLPNVKK